MKKFHTLLRGFMLALVLLSLINPSTIDLAQAAAPAVVTNVVPVPASGQVTLTWTNPASVDFTGTMVRYSTSTFPTSTSDGTLASDVAGVVSGSSTLTVTGLTNGTIYYFSLFSHNAVPEYSAAVNARQLVMGSVFSDNFQSLTAGNVSGQNGWNIVAGTWNVLDTSGEKTLKSGTENLTFDQYRVLNGGTVKTYANQMVRTDWRGTTTNAPGQLFLRAQSATADAAGYVLTQTGGLLRISYKSSTGSSFTSMATGSFTPVANTWYTYEFSVMNNASGLPVLNAYVWTRGSAKPSTPTVTATDTFNRFSQGFFSVGKSATTAAEYDNVTFYAMMSNTASKILPGDGENTLTWTNSAAASYAGSVVRVSTSAYPTTPADGSAVSTVTGSASATSSVTHSGLTNGTHYFYTVFPYDGSGNYGTPLYLNQTPFKEYLNDNFNSSSLGTVVAQNGWGMEAGTWEVSDVSSERVLSASSTVTYLTNMAVNGNANSVNQILSYRYKADSATNTAGYSWLRRQPDNSGYLIWHNANIWTISYQSGASFGTLASGTATTVNAQEANVWFNVEASVINNGSGFPVLTVYAWKEGNEKPATPTVTYTDTSRYTKGTFGLSRNSTATAVYFDDVHYAASLPASVTPANMTITSPAAEVVAEPDTATLAITDEHGTFYIPYIQTSTTLNVEASMAGIPSGGGVRFVLNEGLVGEQVVNDVTGPTYTASFAGLAKDEYTLDAYEILEDGVSLSGDPNAHDYVEHIGIGDIYTVIGDSTSDGSGGDAVTSPVTTWLEADAGSLSLDHRNYPQSGATEGDIYYKESFLTDLNDKISAYEGYPVFFMNEGYLGLGSYQYEGIAMRSGWTTRQLALDANKWLVSLGNGDSQQPHDAATYQTDMETLMARLVTSYGASYSDMYVPYSFYDSRDPEAATLLSYHSVIDSMRSSLGLAGGPNLYDTFINHKPAEYTGIHPNAAGYNRLGRLWAIAIMQPRVTPVVSGHQITLSWDDLSDYESTISGYRVSYGTAADNLDHTVTLGDVTSTTLTGLAWNTTYYYSVVGFDNDPYSVSYTDSSPVASVSTPAGASAANISAITGNTTELGGTATFTVVLNSRPDADVSMGVTSSDLTEGFVSLPSLTFTSSNWDTPQTVTVTGVDDDFADGDMPYSIVIGAMSSTDLTYDGVNPSDVSVTNTDNDTAGFTSTAVSGNTTEVGGTATFTVVLNTEPTADVTIDVSSSDTTEGTVLPSSLTFTPLNWDTPQTVTVTGVNDAIDDGNVSYSIVLGAAVSEDLVYSGINPTDVSVSNTDNDTAGITITDISGNTTEAGGTATFTIVFDSEPTSDAGIDLSSSDTSEGTVSPSGVVFTPLNWATPQTVTVTGVDDDIDDGNVEYSIVISGVDCDDPSYGSRNPSDITLSNTDNDDYGAVVTGISGNTTEAGGTATFTVVLYSEPTADVTIPVSSSDTSEGTVAPSSLIFTALNWDTPQTVTVTGVDDAEDDGDVAYSIVLGAAVSDDGNYGGLDLENVSLSTVDDDDAPPPTETGGSTVPHIVVPVTPPVVVPEPPSNLPELTPEQQQLAETNMQTLDVTLLQDWTADYLQNLVQENAVVEAALQESSFHTVLVNMFEQPHFGIERAEALEFLLVVSGTDITDLKVNSESSYSDVGADYLRAIYIEYATEHDLVGGYSDGRFDPERVMNRAEALKMVANFFGMEVDTSLRGEALLKAYELSQNPFTDADLDAWYAPYLIALYSKGVVQGYSDGRFGPAESISNSELLKMATVVQGL